MLIEKYCSVMVMLSNNNKQWLRKKGKGPVTYI